MIFSKSDYARRAFSSWIYNEYLESLLLTHTFLFIGFSMNDPAITSIIELYAQKYPKLRPHYIFQADPVDDMLSDVARSLRKLFVIKYDPRENHSELPKMLRDLQFAARVKQKEMFASLLSE